MPDGSVWGLLFSAISTLVVVVGAFAAVRQLRYIRHGNELATLTAMHAQFDTAEMREALVFIRTELASAMHDPAFVDELRSAPEALRVRYVLRVANFFESVGVYVHFGALPEGMTATIWGVIAAREWALLRDAVVIIRGDRDVLRFFESFAVRSERRLRSSRFRALLRGLARDPAAPGEGKRATSP